MTLQKISSSSALLFVLCACSSTGVVQTDGDKYMIAKKSAQVGFGPPIGVRAEVYQEANDFCGKQNRSVETINLDLTNAGLAKSAAVTLEFRCIERIK